MRTNGYRIGGQPATCHQVTVGKLQPGDVLAVISKQDRVAHVIDSAPETNGDLITAKVRCQGSIREMTWHKSARLAVVRKAA